jgi:N utilization substance protein B
MLNRRHLRIKILQALYAYELSLDKNLAKAEKELFFSIEKMYDMYLFLLMLMPEMKTIAENRIEEGKRKKLPTEEDKSPNMRFVNNHFLKQLEANIPIQKLGEKKKINWAGQGPELRKLFKAITETEEYQAYMQLEKPTYEDDKEVVIRVFKRHLINHAALQDFFDERSIFWSDDLDLVASMTIKTLKSFSEDADEYQALLPLWKEPEDEKAFVKTLFRKTITQSDEHSALFKKHADNWEVDRIAVMDMILMKMALTEGRELKQIPIKVTLNEYIEISKYYSTPKSKNFINGILDKIFADMKTSGTIKKTGRGLIS